MGNLLSIKKRASFIYFPKLPRWSGNSANINAKLTPKILPKPLLRQKSRIQIIKLVKNAIDLYADYGKIVLLIVLE